MSADIQRARDVLAKWRKEATSKGQWAHDDLGGMSWTVWATGSDPHDADVIHADSGTDAALIVGTAGNPDLLEAIDALLAEALRVQEGWPTAPRVKDTLPLAAAIIAADDRMSR